MTTENRGHVRGEVRAVADDGTIELLAVSYGITDDYGTQFQRGTFTESLEQRLPVIAFGHDWSDPIGRATAFREDDDGLYLTARLDIGGAVPRADQAYAQLRSGTLTDVSVGFMRTSSEDRDGHVMITKAELDEVSVVLRGAVPGAKVLAVRSARTGEMVERSRRRPLPISILPTLFDRRTRAGNESLRTMQDRHGTRCSRHAIRHEILLEEYLPALAQTVCGFVEGCFHSFGYVSTPSFSWAVSEVAELCPFEIRRPQGQPSAPPVEFVDLGRAGLVEEGPDLV